MTPNDLTNFDQDQTDAQKNARHARVAFSNG